MDKPFLTFDEQIEKLKNEYNLIINNYDFANEALSSVSYYDLVNGYQSIYMLNNKYISGITMEQLFATHILNKNIQGVLLKYSTYVENSFKTLLSHVIAKEFTEHQNEYLNINRYKKDHSPNKRKKLKELLDKLSTVCIECKDTPTSYYRNTKNHIPPWILFRNVSFSDTTDLFSFLKSEHKQYFFTNISIFNIDILNFDDKVRITLTSLNLVRKFRNNIAHNLNFLTYRNENFYMDKRANLLFKSNLISENEVSHTRNDVWAMIISIVILLNNKYLIHNFLAELNSFMINNYLAEIYCSISGIPLDLENRIKRYFDFMNFTYDEFIV